jgi:16S rRNA (guanine966-N2)-methyltransferase
VPRIVAGTAKGQRLAVPPRGTRPTSDRAREALFNSLATLLDLDGARVLDLFAGTGAVGLEALSRGAAAASFVESDHAAGEILRHNITATRLLGAQIHRRTVATYLAAAGEDGPFDLIFADPPYGLGEEQVATMLTAVAAASWLVPGGVVVLERSARGPDPQWPDEIEAIKRKRYGEGLLWYGRRR